MKDFASERNASDPTPKASEKPAKGADETMSVPAIRSAVGRMARDWLAGLDLAALADAAAAQAAVDELTSRVRARWPARGGRAADFALLRAIAAVEADIGVYLPKTRPRWRRRSAAEPLRTRVWVMRAREAFAWRDRLDARMAERTLPAGTLVALVLASAAMNGLLLEPAAWAAFARRLRDPQVRLRHSPLWPTIPWVELDFGDGRIRLWRPDAITLGLWARWRALGAPGSAPAPDQVFEAIEAALWPEGRPSDAPIRSARDLASVAFAPLEDEPGADLPEALIESLLGRLPATTLPAPVWEAQLRHPRPGRVKRLAGPKPASRRPRKPPASRTSDPTSGDALDRIGAAIRACGKRERRKLLAAMIELGRQPLPEAALLLVRWYAILLRKGDGPSTIRRYHVAIGAAFVSAAAGAHLSGAGAAELSSLYEGVLALRRGDTMARPTLGSLHAFGQSHPDFLLPPLEIFPIGPDGATRVQAMALSKAMADAILAAVDASPLLDETERVIFGMIFLLCWRGGLRIEESLGRALADATDDAVMTLHVRAHKLGGLKTDAARRNVPVALLMTVDERERCAAFLRRRREEAAGARSAPRDIRLIAKGTDLFEEPVMDADRFRRILQAASRAVGGPEGLAPHGLRHSALSFLHLALLEDDEGVRELTGWSAGQIAELRQAFLGRGLDRTRIYDALAGLAGHQAGETTSESYLHLDDLVAGLRLTRIRRTLDPEAAARAFGLNARSLGDGPTVCPETLRPLFLDRLPVERVGRGRRRSLGRRIVKTVRPSPTPALAWAALSALDDGRSVAEAAAATGLTQAEVGEIAARAKALASLITRKRRRRVASETENGVERLLPDGVFDTKDRDFVVSVAGRLRSLERRQATGWMVPALLDAEPHHPGARHYAPVEARRWIEAMKGVIPATAWRATLHLAETDDEAVLLALWREGLGEAAALETRRTAAFGRDPALRCARALIVNVDEKGKSRWAPVRLAAFLVATLDPRILAALEAADAPDRRRRRQAGL